jgi:uncharacterized membrane protein YccC
VAEPGVGRAGRSSRLTALLRDAARLDRTQADPFVALRNAIGVVAPLIIGALTTSASAGLAPTIGALQTAFADRPGPYRLRLLRMLATAFAAAITSALAVAASRSDVGSATLLLVLAFGAGLLHSAGPSATQVGVAAVAAALLLGHVHQDPGHAVRAGLLVLAGGAGQTLLAVAGWPLGRHRPERLALAGLYRELADTARRPAGPGQGPPATDAVDTVQRTLYGLGHDHGPSVEAYRVLLDEGARIRREIVTLAAMIERIADDDPVGAGLCRSALAGAGDVLAEVADALRDGRPVEATRLDAARRRVRRAGDRLESGPAGSMLSARAASVRLRSLAGQLRAVLEVVGTGASEGGRAEPDDGRRKMLRDPVAVLRANVALDSVLLRHAVRAAVLVGGSDLVVRLAGYDRGYWVPLTALMVLRPDFATTFQRAAMRVAGTIVGLLLATAFLYWAVPDNEWYFIVLIGVFFFAMRLAGPANLLLTAIAISALVVVLLGLSGVSTRATLVDRTVATVIGGALAIAATLLRPVWERDVLPDRLADLIGAYRSYLRVLADPDSSVDERRRARGAARLARTNAQGSLDRVRTDPVPAPTVVHLGESVLANSHRVVHALMTLDSVRSQLGSAPVLADLLRSADGALQVAEESLRGAGDPRGSADVRPVQERLHRELMRDPDRFGGPGAAGAIDDASDRLANGVDTVLAGIRRNTGKIAAIASKQ